MQNSILNSEIDFGITVLNRFFILLYSYFIVCFEITLQMFHIYFEIQKRVWNVICHSDSRNCVKLCLFFNHNSETTVALYIVNRSIH